MNFEWDDEKERRNLAKHGVPFKDATLVFTDPLVVLYPDRVCDDGEQRWHAVGYGAEMTLLVVHVYRSSCDGEEIIRIISARKASKRDIRRYSQ